MRVFALMTMTSALVACVPAPAQHAQPKVESAPIAMLEATPKLVPLGTAVTLDASGSSDPDGDIIGYRWNFGDGQTAQSVESSVRYAYPRAGHFLAEVRVMDSRGEESQAVQQVAVLRPPSIESHPTSLTVDPGAPVSFEVTVSGDGPFGYEWTKDGVSVPGEAMAVLAFDQAHAGDEGTYVVRVSSAAGGVASTPARLTVNKPPQVILHPSDQTSVIGRPVRFWVVAEGSPAPSYQWQKDGTNISGATANEYEIATTDIVDEGVYRAIITNSAGSVTSDEARLTITGWTQPGLPNITSRPPASAAVGLAYEYVITATGDAPLTMFVTGLPSSGNLAFDGVDTIAGTPTAADEGAHVVEVSLGNPIGMDNQRFTLIVVRNAPRITSTPVTGARANHPYTYRLTVTGAPPPVVTVAGLPPSFAFDGTDLITGTATTADLGAHSVVVTASSAAGMDTQAFELSVLEGLDFFEGFDVTQAPAGWIATGDWEFGIPPAGGGSVAATKLASNYSDSVHSTLDTPALDLRGMAEPTLLLHHWYDTEVDFDGGRIALSSDGGTTFTPVPSAQFTEGAYNGRIRSDANNSLAGASAFTGRIGAYADARVDLSAALGSQPRGTVVIRFEFDTDTNTRDLGWYLSHVRVRERAQLP